MHAYLIIGSNQQARTHHMSQKVLSWKTHPSDSIVLENIEGRMGIGEVRSFLKRLLLKPLASDYTVGLIPNAHMLTTEAQQALLKTLEEPPPHVQIIAETGVAQSLLPTILSRMEVITLTQDPATSSKAGELMNEEIASLLARDPIARLNFVDTITKTREEAKIWVYDAMINGEAHLQSLYQSGGEKKQKQMYGRLLQNLLIAKRQLDLNINPKLVLDQAILST